MINKSHQIWHKSHVHSALNAEEVPSGILSNGWKRKNKSMYIFQTLQRLQTPSNAMSTSSAGGEALKSRTHSSGHPGLWSLAANDTWGVLRVLWRKKSAKPCKRLLDQSLSLVCFAYVVRRHTRGFIQKGGRAYINLMCYVFPPPWNIYILQWLPEWLIFSPLLLLVFASIGCLPCQVLVFFGDVIDMYIK